ncbi:DUF998 domain-containing protein [Liquorilactobacillus mali]|uniref:DUF998 domain-containing protein n=1 Tax=Liquorilactobacillus mali KCTC 3596 = DSM 20444 TaxID=1046596 RepID=J1F2N4_9LACO|nr:DUF998 domain-containing protein [Liquorilactobacillus mali]EJE99324.1 hypothetical protein LMA_05941 [Liquorilactobacillus mali KCTC 3596 = DSM 20444]KRN10422.1 hypothetical protein FD00_GL000188 [Liquorilactobacillus mali KCTC 3596 = DSM 20444]MDC7952661.1 DUF998 domain-containing protein [Liquorilactobacillus mali]QFQ74647.1 DUF998 domain-containing protein [Liquorilactobacillus mali]
MIKKAIQIYISLSLILIILAICREISLPAILGIFTTRKHVALLSDFGAPGMPTRHLFEKWELIDGILFILGTPFYYQYLKPISKKYAKLFVSLVVIYGIGDCIFSALFDYSGSYFANWHSCLHAIGSLVGCGALFIANCLLILLLLFDSQLQFIKMFTATQLISIIACVLCLFLESRPLIASTLQIIGLYGLYLPLLVLGLFAGFKNLKIWVFRELKL